MGNCLHKKEEPAPARELKSDVKGSITVLTFAGPQSCFDSFLQEQEFQPTFSDPQFFTNSRRSISLTSFSKE